MLLLSGANDVLRLVSSGTSALDVHASHVDKNGSTITPGRSLTAITTATTTTVVSAPGASTFRTIKHMTVMNKGVGTQTVVVQLYDGTTAYELGEFVLGPNCSLRYHEDGGWWVADSQGRAVTVNMSASGTPSASGDTIVMLASDVTNNNGTANTIADVTGLSFAMTAGDLYEFCFNIIYTAQATATGSRWSINWGGVGVTYINYRSEYSLTTTTSTRNARLQAADLPAACNATSAATGNNWADIYGVIQPSANATLIARFASEVSGSAIVAKAGSFVRYRQITP